MTKEIKDSLTARKQELLLFLRQGNQKNNLQAEVFLEPTIYPQSKFIPQNPVKSIFLTGATGFLGGFILKDLLQKTTGNIYCLVRANDDREAYSKIQKNLKFSGIRSDSYRSRIIPKLGDLSQPRLGLSEQEFQNLSQQIDIIYHSGALLNWVYPYAALKSINVLGTQEILRLACQGKAKSVHYISTTAVWESEAYAGKVVSETEPLVHWSGIELGYSQSKWVAEKLVLLARDRGLPVTIYRPPLISGHSQTGVWNTDDVVCRTIKGCIQMGSMAELDYTLNLSPVDYVSSAIVHLSQQQESIGQVFHLNNPQPLHWVNFVGCLREFGYKIRLIDYEQWQAELSKITQNCQNPLSPLLPFFQKRSPQDTLLIPTQYNRQRLPDIKCQKTLEILQRDRIVCPTVNSELLKKYLQYFIDSKFLDQP